MRTLGYGRTGVRGLGYTSDVREYPMHRFNNTKNMDFKYNHRICNVYVEVV